MNKKMKSILTFVISITLILLLFWFVLPLFDLRGHLGNYYLPIMIIGSLVISYGISYLVGRMLR